MLIEDNLDITDEVSGLRIRVVVGEKLNRLVIEHVAVPKINNREFWFTQNGELDGTGSVL